MLKTMLAVVASAASLLAGESLEPLPGLQDREVIGFSDYGAKEALQGRQVWLEVTESNGRQSRAELIVLFDKRTSSSYWEIDYSPVQSEQTDNTFFNALAGGKFKVYSGGGRIVMFGGVLPVRECREHAASLDDAVRKSLDLARAWASPDEANRVTQFRRTMLLSKIDDSIHLKPLNEADAPVHLESVSREVDGWIVTIRGYWTARIALDEEYNVKHWERVPDVEDRTAH